MPLYEYQCTACGRRTEIIQRVGAPPTGPCSECGGQMKRLISAPAFQFKGSGWYVTDYARKGRSSPSAEKAAGAAEKATDSTSDASSKSNASSSDKGADTS